MYSFTAGSRGVVSAVGAGTSVISAQFSGRTGTRASGPGLSFAVVGALVWGFVLFLGGPILFSILFSFTRYDALSPARYVGAENYRELLADPLFYKCIANTMFMLIRIPLTLVAGLAIALPLLRRQE